MSGQSGSLYGFLRPDGSVGVRNHVLVLSVASLTNPTARRITRAVEGTIAVTTPYGRGQIGPDADLHHRILVGLGRNPNVAAALVLGPDRECADRVAAHIASTGKRVEVLSLAEVEEDALSLTDRGIRVSAHLVQATSRQRRVATPLSALFVGVECGHSDTSSGAVANPLVGMVADRVVDAGGRCVIGETLEWLGAEHVLSERAANPAIGAAIMTAVGQRETAARTAGVDLLGKNPGPENIAGGLSTIEEKSLGAISKGGCRPIQGVLEMAEAPVGQGSYVMDAPYFSPESMTGLVASGAQLLLFTTGAGNSICNALAPTIKVSANPATCRRLREQLDFDASSVLTGAEDLTRRADDLMELLLDVASGTLTFGELLGEGEEVISRLGSSL